MTHTLKALLVASRSGSKSVLVVFFLVLFAKLLFDFNDVAMFESVHDMETVHDLC